jgi:SAM-dependent methyltransferase
VLTKEAEVARLREHYSHVRSFEDRMKYTGLRRMLADRNKALKHLLLGLPKPLRDCRILDFGCAHGYIANFLHSCGASPELLSGCDIQKDMLVTARALYPALDFFESDGLKLPFGDGEIDLITCFTVFSSILDPTIQAPIAQELTRVLAKSGSLIWYDLRWPSPGNRAMTKTRIRELFPQLTPELKSKSLLPPLAKRLGPLTDTLYPVLVSMPPLRSHYLGRLQHRGMR